MTGGLNLFGEGGRTDDAKVLKAKQVDYTPIPVVLQLLLALFELRALTVRRYLDKAAGSGAWGRAMRALCPTAHLIGIEDRASERKNVEAAYDTAIIGDTERLDSIGAPVDLDATNPPFRAFGVRSKDDEERGPFWPEMARYRGWLAPAGMAAMYGLSQWGQAAEHQELHRVWCPSLQIRVGGRIAHRGTKAGDQREYSLFVWDMADRRRNLRRPTWEVVQLEALPDALRFWEPGSVPGTYPVSPELVEQVRKYV